MKKRGHIGLPWLLALGVLLGVAIYLAYLAYGAL